VPATASTVAGTELDTVEGGALMAATYEPRDRGATLVEYALLVAVIAVVCIAAVAVLQRLSPT
jgi:hypothetical protein